jgi:hypothetical protein
MAWLHSPVAVLRSARLLPLLDTWSELFKHLSAILFTTVAIPPIEHRFGWVGRGVDALHQRLVPRVARIKPRQSIVRSLELEGAFALGRRGQVLIHPLHFPLLLHLLERSKTLLDPR